MSNKIIFIEDDLMIIDIFTDAFKQANLDLEIISSGQESIKRIKQIQENPKDKPELIICDLILPDINGMEILKEAKGNDVTKDIPFFVLSNYSDPELQKDGGVKPDKFILKTSITPTQLVELVKKELKVA
jgi:CheY-like chemotaxis protein